MQFIKQYKFLIITAVIVVVLIAVFWNVKIPTSTAPQVPGQTTSSQTSTPGAVSSGSQPSAQPSSSHTTVTAPKTTAIAIVTPAKGEVWVSGNPHTIRWSHQGGATGSIVLLDASSQAVVGYIAQTFAAQQVMYQWDTTSVLLSKTSPLKKTISPGAYMIKVAFDNGQWVESGLFTISASGSDVLRTRNVIVKYDLFSPNAASVTKGEYVVVINDDTAKSHTLKLNGTPIVTLAFQDAYVFDASKFAAGSYEFRISDNALAKLVVTVQ